MEVPTWVLGLVALTVAYEAIQVIRGRFDRQHTDDAETSHMLTCDMCGSKSEVVVLRQLDDGQSRLRCLCPACLGLSKIPVDRQ